MIESYKQAIEEYKRVDHLFHVSLKYTRTVDVLRSVMERIISTYENAIDAILKCMKEEGIIEAIPENPVGKGALAQEKCDEELCKYFDIYLTMRRMMRASYTKREEYRRHVTMILDFEDQEVNVDIDSLGERYAELGEFLKYAKTRVEKYKDD